MAGKAIGAKGKSASVKARPPAAATDSLEGTRAHPREGRGGKGTRARGGLVAALRGPRSIGYFLVFLGVALIIQGAHALEHIVQTLQVFVFGVPRPQAGGILGSTLDFPWVHFSYNFFFFITLAWATAWAFGLGGFRRFDRWAMWALIIAAGIQTYHAGEHVIQIAQELAVGTARPPGFIGFFQDNVIAHLTLNVVEWVVPFFAFWKFGGLSVMKDWLLLRKVTTPSGA